MATISQEETHAPVLQMKAQANRLYSSKDYRGAAAIYSTILNYFNKEIPPLLVRVVQCNRAACMIELEQYREALPDLEEVIREGSDGQLVTQKAHFRRARCLCELGRYMDAMQELERYREITGGIPNPAETSLYTKILGGIINIEKASAQFSPVPPLGTPNRAAPNTKTTLQIRYEIRVSNMPTPIIKHDTVPRALCLLHPPEIQTRAFLANLVKKHHRDVMNLNSWICWNCPARAVSLVHTPASYIHLADPHVVDFAQPVCVNGGACEKAARDMMSKEIQLVAAQARAAP